MPDYIHESARDRRIRLSDARALGYAAWGDPDGAPVLGFHGRGHLLLWAIASEVLGALAAAR